MDQAEFVEHSLLKIWSDIIYILASHNSLPSTNFT